MQLRHFRSFVTEDGGGGNAAAVFDYADNAGVEAFIERAKLQHGELTCILREGSGPSLRFFFPTGEMAFCGHGILAAATLVLGDSGGAFAFSVGDRTVRGNVSQKTLPFAEYWSETAPAESLSDDAVLASCLDALSLSIEELAVPHLLRAGADRPKTLLALRSKDRLNAIDSSSNGISHVCELAGSTGLYAFVVVDDAHVEARQFPHNAGFAEDPATGNAAIALASAAKRGYISGLHATGFQIRQGAAMRAPSDLFVRAHGTGFYVGGRIVSEAMELDSPR